MKMLSQGAVELVKSGILEIMNRPLISLFFISVVVFVQNNSEQQLRFSEVAKAEEQKLSTGLLFTVKFGIRINYYEKDGSVEKYLKVEKKEIRIGIRDFELEIAHQVYNKEFSTVVGHFAFSGYVNEGNGKYFAINFHKTFPNYNLLLIQKMASATFAEENCSYIS